MIHTNTPLVVNYIFHLKPKSHTDAGYIRPDSACKRVAAVWLRVDPCRSWNVRHCPWGSGRPTRQSGDRRIYALVVSVRRCHVTNLLSGNARWVEEDRQAVQLHNCCGALDGKKIAIQCHRRCGSLYYNYKGHYSIILMALFDADYKCIWAEVGIKAP